MPDSSLLASYASNYFRHATSIFPILDEEAVHGHLELLCRRKRRTQSPRLRRTWSWRLAQPCRPDLRFSMCIPLPDISGLRAAGEYEYAETTGTVAILLLFTIYSLLDASAGSSWQLVDLAMQSCIVLGLHQSQRARRGGNEDAEHRTDALPSGILARFVSLSTHPAAATC